MIIEEEVKLNKNLAILRLFGFEYDPLIITNRLGISPKKTGIKGEKYYRGKSSIPSHWDFNHWEYEWKKLSPAYIGEFITEFFNEILIPRQKELVEISKNCPTIRIVIVQYYYNGCNPGYNLTKEQIAIMAEINAEIEFDVYCLGKINE